MLIKVEARSPAGALLILVLDDTSDGYVLRDVEGLTPVKASIASSKFANVAGSQYQSSRRDERNIVIKLDLEPDYITQSVKDLRTNLYRWFMTDEPVDLRFYDSGGLEVDVSGRVEFCEAPLFTREPKVDISIICFSPDLVDITPVEIAGETVEDSTEMLIEYDGTVDTGIIFVLNVDRTLTEFTIYHRAPDGVIRSFELAADLEADDVVTLNTNVGSKSVTLTRDGTDTSLMYGRAVQSNWIQLKKGGDNYIRVLATGTEIPYEISYTTKYGGL